MLYKFKKIHFSGSCIKKFKKWDNWLINKPMEIDETVKVTYYQKVKKITGVVWDKLQIVRFGVSGFTGTMLFYVK